MRFMIRGIQSVSVAIALAFLLSGCATMPGNGITQVATIDALLTGVYDGHMSLKTLRQYGDFGIGTFERLDGEMILLDGKFYKVRADGKIYRPNLSERTPFACVTKFVPDCRETIKNPTDMKALEAKIDALLPQQNRFCAFVARGTFRQVRARSVPSQSKPYPPLTEVTKNQPVFTLANVRGTLIGFRSPDFVKGVNVPGYHMHFLTDDLASGGHVLEFEMTQGVLEADTVHEWLNIYLPTGSASFGTADLAQDRTADLQVAEKAARPGDKPSRPAGVARFLTEEYEPLNYTENGMVTGLSVEVVREMSKCMQRTTEIKVADWADGYRMALQGPDTVLFSTAMTAERKNLFKWVGPLATIEARFYALKGTSLSIKTPEDARAVKAIATVKDYYMEQELISRKFANLVTCKNGAEAARKVLNGEAVLMPYNNTAMPMLLKQMGYPADALVPVYTISIDPVYLAFSKDVSDATVKEWQDALDLLKKNGAFARIYAKWLPQETPPGILQLLTEDYPPLTFKQDGEVTGLATDIVKEICSRNKIPANILMYPWSSAYATALVNPNVLLFSAERTKQREDLFNWVGPLGQNATIFYARKGAGIIVKNLDDAKKIPAIGTTTEWFSEQYLQGQGFRNLKSSSLPSATIKKLMEGEVDLAVFTDITIPEIAKSAGYSINDIEPVFVIMKSYFYIAVSLGTPGETVSQWQKTLDAMKADGTFQRIYQTYVPGADVSALW